MERDDKVEGPTVTMKRDALLGLIDRSIAPPAALAHTVSREELRSRAPTRDETPTAELPAQQPVEPLDVDLTPSLSPWLIAGVIAVLLVVFIAATHLH